MMTLLHNNRSALENFHYVLSTQALHNNDLFIALAGMCWHARPRKLKQVQC